MKKHGPTKLSLAPLIKWAGQSLEYLSQAQACPARPHYEWVGLRYASARPSQCGHEHP